MVPDNIIWAAFSSSEYEKNILLVKAAGLPDPKDIWYQNPNGEWVKVTATFNCIDELRKTYNHGDVQYLGAVLENTKGEIERGRKYPPVPEDKKTLEQKRKEEILAKLGFRHKSINNYDFEDGKYDTLYNDSW